MWRGFSRVTLHSELGDLNSGSRQGWWSGIHRVLGATGNVPAFSQKRFNFLHSFSQPPLTVCVFYSKIERRKGKKTCGKSMRSSVIIGRYDLWENFIRIKLPMRWWRWCTPIQGVFFIPFPKSVVWLLTNRLYKLM